MIGLQTKLYNYERALHRLNEAIDALKLNTDDDITRDAVIQRFEFTFELCWKTAKQYLEATGIAEINSPKAVFRECYAQRLISNEENWLLILKDRNLTAHVYNDEMAKEIAQRIIDCHAKEFKSLLTAIKKDVPS